MMLLFFMSCSNEAELVAQRDEIARLEDVNERLEAHAAHAYLVDRTYWALDMFTASVNPKSLRDRVYGCVDETGISLSADYIDRCRDADDSRVAFAVRHHANGTMTFGYPSFTPSPYSDCEVTSM